MTALLTLHDPANTVQFYEQGYWRKDSFYALLKRNAGKRPDAFFIRDARRRVTYAQALAWVDALAARMEKSGLFPGDRVAISLPNRVEVPFIFLACSRNRYVCVPSLHQNYTTKEVVELLTRIRASAVFTIPDYGVDGTANDRGDAAVAVPTMKRVFRVGLEHQPGDAGPEDEGPCSLTPGGADDVVYLAFTSGTTGMPKAVMHSDNTLLANSRQMVVDWGHDENTVLYALSPLSHHNGWVALGQMLSSQGELVVGDLPKGMKPLDRILEVGATYIMGVPTHAIDLLADIKSRGMNSIGKVKTWYIAGATIPPEVSRSIIRLGATPQNVYGMTENSSHQYAMPDDDEEILTSTCGRATLGYEVRIFDPENRNIEFGIDKVGEIAGRGACLMLGYFDNQKATEESFNATGWFMTGDLGKLDAKGNLTIVGRAKDLIIRGGHNIYPSQIENLAVTHPVIEKAAAFGVADARLGERICLAVSFAQGQSLKPLEVLAHLDQAGLSKFDMPEFFIEMPVMPTTASGKILKRELVVMVTNETIRPEPVRWQG